jgi:hypothetical protein
MRINNETGQGKPINGSAPLTHSGAVFGRMLSKHMKPQSKFNEFIRDSLAEIGPQAIEEVEKICGADDTGESIDISDLDVLLDLIINERNGKL